jgi:hypothetical protein
LGWNSALEHVAEIEARVRALDEASAQRPSVDRAALLSLAHDLPKVWNSTETDAGAKQRLTRILIQEVVIDLDDKSNEAIVTVRRCALNRRRSDRRAECDSSQTNKLSEFTRDFEPLRRSAKSVHVCSGKVDQSSYTIGRKTLKAGHQELAGNSA